MISQSGQYSGWPEPVSSFKQDTLANGWTFAVTVISKLNSVPPLLLGFWCPQTVT